jgi:hypothetical protein
MQRRRREDHRIVDPGLTGADDRTHHVGYELWWYFLLLGPSGSACEYLSLLPLIGQRTSRPHSQVDRLLREPKAPPEEADELSVDAGDLTPQFLQREVARRWFHDRPEVRGGKSPRPHRCGRS